MFRHVPATVVCFFAAVVAFGACPACAQDAKQPPTADSKKDLDGDPLPTGAVARLGSARLRQAGLIGPYYTMSGTVAYLPDGKTLLSAGSWSFRFWDTEQGRPMGGIDLEKDELPQRITLAASALAPDGKTLAVTMRYEATIRLLDAATGKEIRRFEGHVRGNGTRSVTRVDFSPNGKMLASTATDGTLRLWDVASGKELHKLNPFDPVRRIPIGLLGDINPMVRFSPDSRMLVSKDGGNLRLWELASGKEIRKLLGAGANPQGVLGGVPGTAPVDAVFSPDSRVVAVAQLGSINSTTRISLWETLTGKKIRDIEFESEKLKLGKFEQIVAPTLRAIAFSPDGKSLAAALDTGSFTYESRGIHVFDWNSGKKTAHLLGHNRIVCSLAFAPDSKTLGSAAGDGTIRLWDVAGGKEIERGSGGSKMWVEAVAVSKDGKLVASAGQDNAIAVWDAATGKLMRRIAGAAPLAQPGALYNRKVWSLAFSPSGDMLAAGSGDSSIYLWDPATGQQIRRLDGHKHWARAIAFSPDGKTLASASQDKTVRLWNAATGELIREFGGHGDGVRSVGFSSDGKILASISEHAILLWDPATGNRIPHQVNKLAFDGLSMALSPDGKSALIGGGHGSFEAHLIDLTTGNQIGVGPHKDAVWAVAYSPDGKRAASVGHDHKVCLLDTATGKLLARFDAQQGPVFSVAFTSNSKTLLTGGEDTTVVLWDIDQLERTGGPTAPANKNAAEPNQQQPAKTDKSSRESGKAPADTDQGPRTTDKKPTDDEAAKRIAKELEPQWTALASDDPSIAFEAIAALVAIPEKAIPFLKGRLLAPPPPAPDSKRLAQLIADLGSPTFSVRDKASDELEKFGEAAGPALSKALAEPPSLEAKSRIANLLDKLPPVSANQLRQVRAVQTLEYAGTPEARQLLAILANDTTVDRRSRDAQESLQRLLKRRQSE
jgi:WD40 repeat protein